VVRKNIEMPLLKYFTLAVALSRVAAEGPCVDEPDATLPGGWDCARIAEYIAGSDVHSCSWAGPWLSVMVAPKLAEEAAAKCPLSCNECAPDDVDAVDDRVEDNAPAAGLAKEDPAYEPEAPDAPTTEGEPDADPEAVAAEAAAEAASEGEGEDEDDHPAPCVDMAQVELAGGWSCERVASYLRRRRRRSGRARRTARGGRARAHRSGGARRARAYVRATGSRRRGRRHRRHRGHQLRGQVGADGGRRRPVYICDVRVLDDAALPRQGGPVRARDAGHLGGGPRRARRRDGAHAGGQAADA
jgi:hypothetical protein